MAQEFNQDIYARVNSFYGLKHHNPSVFKGELITADTPIIRYIVAETQASRHLVFEIAAVKHDTIQHLGLSFYCTKTELHFLIEEMLAQNSVSDERLEGPILKIISDHLVALKENPSWAPDLGGVLVHEWKPSEQFGGDGVETDGAGGDGHDGGIHQRMNGVHEIHGGGLFNGDEIQAEEFIVEYQGSLWVVWRSSD
ncbi:hypothetical protein M419DRAFT_6401 [Trichoderma reesei RUT C-30]|uniref:Uncharacterized protein n=1 Tax=Hypocrea jecorina (strain ATCC 56765 / BCRC 32924 / NRRL 11460 / Rut C-30) TaxID=1344414 RepID=A0A024SG59_HYPJR|nr:hypothetical protein M419DRAFT_6401 [Trichoderma reesei RUT C-30]